MTTAGYAALTETVALLETPRALFRVRGPRARRIVNGLVTNALDGLDRGVGCYAFALTAKGRPIAELRVLPIPGFEAGGDDGADDGEALWIDAPAEAETALRDLFARTVPPIFATVEEEMDIRRMSLVGPASADPALLAACGVELGPGGVDPADEPLLSSTVRFGSDPAPGLLVRREPIEGGGLDLYVPTGTADRLRACLLREATAAGGAEASTEDWEILRVERGLPAFGAEITADNLPQETGQTARAISFEKGCYTGQEVVARIHYRGHVNRVLRGLRADPPDAPALVSGRALSVDGREVGRTSTTVTSPRLGRIGLAYVRRDVVPGSRLSLGEDARHTVEVVELPFTDR